MYRTVYKKYESESESETDSDTDSSSSSGSEGSEDSGDSRQYEGFQGADFKALADGLKDTTLPTDVSGQITLLENQASITSISNPIGGSGYPTFKNLELKPDPSGNLIEAKVQSVASVILMDSRNRDKTAFPQPTNVTLRLPRTYKNVTSFSIVQMKLLSAFYYFRASKQNLDISILELGRTVTNPNSGIVSDNVVKNFIRQGTYSIDSLLAELTLQVNRTPIFYDYINGFQDFAKRFSVTGDFSLNFNYPGDSYYDSLLNQYIPNPTMDLIISKYFVNRYAGLSSYTTDQLKIAYYYPVLKEILLDDNYTGTPINLTLSAAAQALLLEGETATSRVVYTFQGLYDGVVLELISNNITALDSYRLAHTFRYTLVNKYNISYEQQSNQVLFQCPSLNTSLVNLINYKQAQFFAEQLSYYGLTLAQFNGLNAQNAILLAVINDMVTFYKQFLAKVFGITFNTFAASYLLNDTLTLPIRDGLDAIGVSSNFNPNLNVSQVPTSNDVLGRFRQDAPQYWNRMKNLPDTTFAYMNPVLPGEDGSKAINYYTWNSVMDQQDTLNPIVLSNVLDSNNPNTTPIGNLYVNHRTQFADVIIPLEAAEYTVFRFKSPVRQTLRVETLPRPTKYRYPLYNAATYDVSHQTLFDNSYCFVQGPQNVNMDVSSNDFNPSQIRTIPGFSVANSVQGFGVNFSTSASYWGQSTVTLSILESRAYHTFYTPFPPTISSINAPAYKYPLSLNVSHYPTGDNFASPLQIFLYQDRGGFMADISSNRLENPRNYISTFSTSVTASTATFNFIAYANKQYYVLSRSQSISFANETFQIIPSFPSSTNFVSLTSSIVGFNPIADPNTNLNNYNYAQVADPAFIKLPIQSTLYPPPSVDFPFSTLTYSTSLMGYDTNGVSTDLTNYIGFISNVAASTMVPNSRIRIDPANGYLYQSKSGYNSTTETYLYANTLNSILGPQGASVYTPSAIPFRQQSIVHWYGNTFIPPTKNQLLFDPKSIAYQSIPPFTNSFPVNAPMAGYRYYTAQDISGNTYLNTPNLIDLGDGVIGIAFLPDQGVWDINRFMFKSIFTSPDPAIDPNLGIRHIGIYPAVSASNSVVQAYSLSNALAVLSFHSSITYNSTATNFGFDVVGGTYYEFTRDSNFLVGSNSYLYGYSQGSYDYNFDINSYYIAVPFNASQTIQYYYGLVGSAVPYPLYSGAAIVPSVESPEGPHAPPNGAEFILPSGVIGGPSSIIYGPQAPYTAYQSQYEQSMPIGTNLLLYANPYPINTVSNAFNAWSSFSFVPTEVLTDCSGYILLKDSDFKVYQYTAATSNTSFDESYNFTLDQVYPSASNINYLGMAANESNFAFFGLSNASPTPVLYIRTFNPKTGIIENTFSEPSPAGFQSSVQLFRATYNNFGGYTMACQSYNSNTNTTDISVVSKAQQGYSSLTFFNRQVTGGAQSTIQYFITGQSPKEEYGRFWVFPYRTGLSGPIAEGVQDFAFVNPNSLNATVPVGNYTARYTAYDGATPTYATVLQYSLSNTAPYTFRSPIVVRDVAKDRLFFLSDDQPTSFYETPIVTGEYEPTVIISQYSFPSTPTALYAGANGGAWAQIYDTLYGNRQDVVDGPKRSVQSWQIFYPVHKVVLHQIARNFTFMYDLSGLDFPEYPHTAVAVYDNSGAVTNDTSKKWGLESASNFNSADFDYAGFYFNSYTYGALLSDNRSSDDFYYMTIRSYSPTEKSQVMLRVSAPNKYTFGYVTPVDISSEISTAKYVNSTMNSAYTYYWDSKYVTSLLNFDSNFIIDSNGKSFGGGVIAGFPGSNISSVTGFGDFYSRMQAVYSTYSTQVLLVSTINAATASNVTTFIKTDLAYIIPPSALSRQRFTDPLRFSIRWKSALLPQYAALEEEWGLGWNLGFTKVNTPYETVQRAPSFFKIIDDFINLRLNPEYDMNRVDTGQKENLSLTLDTTGSTKAFYGKLLLAPFGSYAQTLVSNPIAFLNPLGKLDKITFQWTDAVGAIINNADCEWNCCIQISENLDTSAIKKPPPINPVR